MNTVIPKIKTRHTEVSTINTLGLDAGASSLKWAVCDDAGHALEAGRTDPITGHLFDAEAQTKAFGILKPILERAKALGARAGWAGVTGLSAGNDVARTLEEHIAQELGVDLERVTVMNDMDLAYRADFRLGEGILVYAGTGSVAYHVREDGGVVRAGGHGYLIADDGGGFSIGRAALRTITRWMDLDRDPQGYALGRLVLEQVGGSDWNTISQYVYGGGRRAVAALAPFVGQAAALGDTAAERVLEQAGADLADLAGVMLERLGSKPVILAGGALRVSPIIERSAREHLPSNVSIAVSTTDYAMAAARLAKQS